VRLLIKNLARHLPEEVFREELESVGICAVGVLQLRSGRSDQEAPKSGPLTPHFIVSVDWSKFQAYWKLGSRPTLASRIR
jgi:hypothetical protein